MFIPEIMDKMNWRKTKLLIKSDLRRLNKTNNWRVINYLFTNASFKITFWFRIGSYLQTRKGLLWKFLFLIISLIHKHYQYLTGIQLSIGTQVGEGVNFPHFSCIIINGSDIIGKNCTIYQGVTIGSVRGKKGVPIIGDNVVIASHVQIIGNVKIGNNVMIGAGSIITKDIPDNAVVIGNPAHIISYNGLEHIKYFINNESNTNP